MHQQSAANTVAVQSRSLARRMKFNYIHRPMAKKIQSAPKSFEEALAELEQIVSAIEGGQVGLEESLLATSVARF